MSGQRGGRGRGRGETADLPIRGGRSGRSPSRGDRGAPGRGDRGDRGRGDRGDRGDRGRGDRGDRGRGDRGAPGRGDRGRGDRGRGDRGRGDRGRGGGGGPGEKEVFSHGPGDAPQRDAKVQKMEDETEQAIKTLKKQGPGAPKPPSDATLPLRPGFGTAGKPIMLWANYFELSTLANLSLFRYGIDILPDASGRKPTGKKVKRIVQLLIEEHFSQQMNSMATDYKSNLICRFQVTMQQEPYVVRYRSEEEDQPAQNARNYHVRVQHTGSLQVSELIRYLTSTPTTAGGAAAPSKEEIIQALNIVLGHHPKAVANITSIGANKHYDMSAAPSEKMDLGAGLQAIRGFFISVRAATARLLVNVQVKSAAFYQEGPLGLAMDAWMDANGQNKFRLDNFLKRVRLRVTHIRRTNSAGEEIPRIKTIAGLATPRDGQGQPHPPIVPSFGAGPRDVKFFVGTSDEPEPSTGPGQGKAGEKGKKPPQQGPRAPPSDDYISVYDFFRTRYNITCADPRKPVVNVGTRQNPSYLPVDVCQIVAGQPCGTKLSPAQTQQMIRFAVRKPAQNARSIITNGARTIGVQPATNSLLDDYNLKVNPRLITVPGRVLGGPIVRYRESHASTRFGSWNMQAVKFSTAANIPSWTCLHIMMPGPRQPLSSSEAFFSTLNNFQAKMRECGIEVQNYSRGSRFTLAAANDYDSIDAEIKKLAKPETGPPPRFLLVILPFADDAMYNTIKVACDIKYGIRSVCVVGSKFAKDRNDQYFANVALKVNLKIGGRNQFLDNNKVGLIAENKTMVVGIDVTHPSPGSSSTAPSVVGIVASIDNWLSQFPAEIRIQASRQEMVSDLSILLKTRLQLWFKKNNRYPENIIVYRDGVSEGQYDLVLNQELPLLRKACQETYPATETKKGVPRMSIIIVGKRHHTRFYPIRADDADRSSNPPNGTIVDRAVTEARNWDFFLQAHAALQGTARPAHYYIVLDEIFRGRALTPPFQNAADALEDLTHNMCYLYGRATKAVSICPPAYYADLVCERGRKYLSRFFDATPGQTPSGSLAQGEPGGEMEMADPGDVKIHDNVKDSMFYI